MFLWCSLGWWTLWYFQIFWNKKFSLVSLRCIIANHKPILYNICKTFFTTNNVILIRSWRYQDAQHLSPPAVFSEIVFEIWNKSRTVCFGFCINLIWRFRPPGRHFFKKNLPLTQARLHFSRYPLEYHIQSFIDIAYIVTIVSPVALYFQVN